MIIPGATCCSDPAHERKPTTTACLRFVHNCLSMFVYCIARNMLYGNIQRVQVNYLFLYTCVGLTYGNPIHIPGIVANYYSERKL